MGNSDSRCSHCQQCSSDHSNDTNDCTCSCESNATCTCKCNVGNGHDIAQKAAAITAGVLASAGGIAVTVFTGGVALPIVGGMVAGFGFSSAIHGSVKAIKKEKISGKDYGVDVGVGFVTGVIGSGSVAATEGVAKAALTNVAKEACKRGAAKLGFRVAGGVASSVAATAVHEVGECTKGNKSWKDYGNDPKKWSVGVASGVLAGAGTHVASNVSKVMPQTKNAVSEANKIKDSTNTSGSAKGAGFKSAIQSTEKQKEYMGKLALESSVACKTICDKSKEQIDIDEGKR